LYYAETPSTFLFGSEIKALLTWPGLRRSPNLAAIDRYLTLQYVPAPETAFTGIKRLPPAHYLIVGANADGGWYEPELVRYWESPAPEPARPAAGPAELRRELITHLEEAVRLRMIADVPLGAFLSGGVDSSAVVAMMARAGHGRVKTFSIGFRSPQYDERRY